MLTLDMLEEDRPAPENLGPKRGPISSDPTVCCLVAGKECLELA